MSECPSADEVVIEAGTLQMNLSPSPRINPHPVHPWFTEPHHSVMLLPPCLFHYLLWTLRNLVVAILYVTPRNVSRDLAPSSPPNLISSSRGAARKKKKNEGEEEREGGGGTAGEYGNKLPKG